jgi:hypothetical protein
VLLAEVSLTILLAQVTTTPDAGADPNGCDTDNENNNHDNPLPMVGDPDTVRTIQGMGSKSPTYQSPPPPLLDSLLPDVDEASSPVKVVEPPVPVFLVVPPF